MKPAIVTDSNSGITQAQARELGIFVLPMPVIIDGTVYYEDVDLTAHQFFQALDRRQTVTTSQPAPDDVTSLWDRVLASHDQLVYIPMSSGLSSSCAAAAALAEDYEGRVSVVNNHRISETQRSAILDALALAEAGCTGAEIRQELEQSALDSVIYIGVETLEYLRRGAILPELGSVQVDVVIPGDTIAAGVYADLLEKPWDIPQRGEHRHFVKQRGHVIVFGGPVGKVRQQPEIRQGGHGLDFVEHSRLLSALCAPLTGAGADV